MEVFMKPVGLFQRIFFFLLSTSLCLAHAEERLELPLANIYRQGVDVSRYWVSEKLDGVRASWNGSVFLSRNGNSYQAPAWFSAGFPKVRLDGELWMGRGTFQQLVSAVRKQQPVDEEWRGIRYMVFDLPAAEGGFSKRLESLERLFHEIDSPYMQRVEQYRLADHRSLMEKLQQVVAEGGEGLMLHHEEALYLAGRSDDLLKVKPYMDAEALVIAHLPGKGKYVGQLGALLVESTQGKRFRIGTGFTDAERRHPPPVGSWVSYKYHGHTDQGVPRFPSFLRVRTEE
jgi:DNA ligase-1